MPYVKANGIDIWYEVLGEGLPGTPLVMTHGFASASRVWRPDVEPLAGTRPVVMYDVRGHDRTTAPEDASEYSMPTFAADLATLLRAIGIERAHVGGVSMGGMVTAQFAVNYAEMCESVLLSDTTCGNRPGEGTTGAWEKRLIEGMGILSHMVQKYGFEETLRREDEWKQTNDRHIAESPYSFEDDMRRINLMTMEGYLGAAHAIATRPDLTDRVREIKAPTLVMIGGWDDFLPCSRRDHEAIVGSRLVVRERCGHGSRWRNETFVSEIEGFLADVEAGKAVAGERRV